MPLLLFKLLQDEITTKETCDLGKYIIEENLSKPTLASRCMIVNNMVDPQ